MRNILFLLSFAFLTACATSGDIEALQMRMDGLMQRQVLAEATESDERQQEEINSLKSDVAAVKSDVNNLRDEVNSKLDFQFKKAMTK